MKCACCNRIISDPISVSTGFGPVCREKLGLITVRTKINGQKFYKVARQTTIWDFMA